MFMHLTGMQHFFMLFDSTIISYILCYFAAGLLNWGLISLINLATSLLFRYTSPKTGSALSVS